MRTISINYRMYAVIVLLIGVVSLSACSGKSDSDQGAKTSADTNSESQPANETSTKRDVSGVVPEMGLVVQNYGMAKFSELKRLNDVGYALFSIFPDGTISSGTSANLSNYEIDWSSAKMSSYSQEAISFLTPSIKDLNSSELVSQQQVIVALAAESKVDLKAPESLAINVSIETLVSDSLRTICAMGFSSR